MSYQVFKSLVKSQVMSGAAPATVIVQLSIALFFRLTGAADLIGSQQPITAPEGQDVILLCHVIPALDVSSLTVEWRHNGNRVHVYRHGTDDSTHQHKDFSGRTSLFYNEMKNGNVSLKLTSVRKLDAGTYKCVLPKLGGQFKEAHVTLEVAEDNDNSRKVVATNSSSVGVTNSSDGVGDGIVIVIVICVLVVIGIVIYLAVNKKKICGNNVL